MSPEESLKRQVWAVETLGIQPRDRVLEIGCGPGLAVSLVCDRLSGGHILAVDRSSPMIAKASQRNHEAIAAGKAEFLTGDFADIDFGRRKFDRIFSFNVNVFWMDPAGGLRAVRKLLATDGYAYFFYLPPSMEQFKKIKERLPSSLAEYDFHHLQTMEKKFGPLRAVCFQAVR